MTPQKFLIKLKNYDGIILAIIKNKFSGWDEAESVVADSFK
jgi:hypothetical protein